MDTTNQNSKAQLNDELKDMDALLTKLDELLSNQDSKAMSLLTNKFTADEQKYLLIEYQAAYFFGSDPDDLTDEAVINALCLHKIAKPS